MEQIDNSAKVSKYNLPIKRVASAREAIGHIRNGARVFISTAVAQPTRIIDELLLRYENYADVEIVHLASSGPAHFVAPHLRNHFRYNAFSIGDGVAPALASCRVDYTPINLAELPSLFRTRRYALDVAIITTTPPDDSGYVSLGLSVDVAKEAVASADLVIAEVNGCMPRTRGDTLLAIDDIDWFVEHDQPPLEIEHPGPRPIDLEVGRNAAMLVSNGDILHLAYDRLPYAVLPFLRGKRNLGLHVFTFTDPLMDLVIEGVVDNSTKFDHPGQTLATSVVGSKRLYDFVDRNRAVTLVPLDQINSRQMVDSRNRLVSFRAALKADITGNVLVDTTMPSSHAGMNTELAFLNEAAVNGLARPVLMLTATDPLGGDSNILAQLQSFGGNQVDRASVHYVCTEYGFAHLHAKTLRERALAMIAISDPRARDQLMAEAKRLGYVPADQVLMPHPACIYPNELVCEHTFTGGLTIFLRPVHPSDERGLQRLFYWLSPESVFYRYHGAIKSMHRAKVQTLANIDYRKDVAIVGMVGERGTRELVCVGRYMYYGDGQGEVDLSVADRFHGHDIGSFLLHHVTEIAIQRGMRRLNAEILQSNKGARRLFDRVWPDARRTLDTGVILYTLDLA